MSRRPLQLSVNDLRNRLGQRRDFSIDVDLEPLTVISSRTTADPVVGMVVLESISRGVSAVGSVNFGWESECRRCLKVLSGKSDAPIDEIFQVNAPGDSEIIPFDGEHLDLMPVVRAPFLGFFPSRLCALMSVRAQTLTAIQPLARKKLRPWPRPSQRLIRDGQPSKG